MTINRFMQGLLATTGAECNLSRLPPMSRELARREFNPRTLGESLGAGKDQATDERRGQPADVIADAPWSRRVLPWTHAEPRRCGSSPTATRPPSSRRSARTGCRSSSTPTTAPSRRSLACARDCWRYRRSSPRRSSVRLDRRVRPHGRHRAAGPTSSSPEAPTTRHPVSARRRSMGPQRRAVFVRPSRTTSTRTDACCPSLRSKVSFVTS